MSEFDTSIEEAIDKNGEIMVCSSGISMYPMVRHRKDMVVIEKLNRPLKKYDVPVYRTKTGKIVMHRILKITPDGYIIRGDNLFQNEYDIKNENIIGVLKAFYRNGKHVDCTTSKMYKFYIFYIRFSYPARYVWKIFIRPFLSKIKHAIFK